MNRFRSSLAARIFFAIAATAVLIIAIMAVLVALSMRDGFAQYLLRGELARFDDLERALVLAHDADAPGWPELAGHPRDWNVFQQIRAETLEVRRVFDGYHDPEVGDVGRVLNIPLLTDRGEMLAAMLTSLESLITARHTALDRLHAEQELRKRI